MNKVKEKSPILITGGSRGIGRGIAIELAKRGADVIITYNTNKNGADKTCKAVQEYGAECGVYRMDISDEDNVKKCMNEIHEEYGKVYGIINNAGAYMRTSIEDLTTEKWKRTMDINLNGPYYVTMNGLDMIKDGGTLIYLGSMIAKIGRTHGIDYSSAKAGLTGFARSMMHSLSHRKIRVNIIAPGYVYTDILGMPTGDALKKRENEVPLGRVAYPEDIGKLAAFLVLDDTYINGEVININGGLMLD